MKKLNLKLIIISPYLILFSVKLINLISSFNISYFIDIIILIRKTFNKIILINLKEVEKFL
jgi:hypothetical protein